MRIENCVAFRNGLDLWGIEGFTGNGNGFKLGGDFIPAAHVVIGCVATDQPKRGFDQNNNTAGLTVEHCTAIRCLLWLLVHPGDDDRPTACVPRQHRLGRPGRVRRGHRAGTQSLVERPPRKASCDDRGIHSGDQGRPEGEEKREESLNMNGQPANNSPRTRLLLAAQALRSSDRLLLIVVFLDRADGGPVRPRARTLSSS